MWSFVPPYLHTRYNSTTTTTTTSRFHNPVLYLTDRRSPSLPRFVPHLTDWICWLRDGRQTDTDMQAAGQWDSWDSWYSGTDRHTHSGIIIKSNLVSFKCDLYAESVCPFFPKTKKKKKKKLKEQSNPIQFRSIPPACE